jgi:hypothetical protein
MAVTMKLDPMFREVVVAFPEVFSDKAKSEALARFAQENINAANTQNARIVGHPVPYDVRVDGNEGARLSSVKPHGRIEAEWTFFDDLFAWIGQQLVKHSPIGRVGDPRPGHPGLYMESHLFMVDGREVRPGERPPPMASEYVFINSQPYARKIERGLSDQAPDGVYETVAVLANNRWGNLARIRFSYRSLLGSSVHAWAKTTKMVSKAKGARREQWLTRQPAIVITPR